MKYVGLRFETDVLHPTNRRRLQAVDVEDLKDYFHCTQYSTSDGITVITFPKHFQSKFYNN